MSLLEWQTDVDHKGFIKIQSVDSLPAPNASHLRRIVYLTTAQKFYACNGATWEDLSANSAAVEGAAPVGAILPFAGIEAEVPTGALLCNGQELDPSVYDDLFSVIGTTYNTGGETPGWFRVPDLRGRVVAGRDNMGGAAAGRLDDAKVEATADPANPTWEQDEGGTAGEQVHQLDVGEMPSHTHPEEGTNDSGFLQAGVNGPFTTAQSTTTGSRGGDESHNNVQPTMVVNYIIIAVPGAGSGLVHNALEGLQGGSINEYYHMSEDEHTNIQSLSGGYIPTNNIIMAGAIENFGDTTPGYIDSSSVVENDGIVNAQFTKMDGVLAPVVVTAGSNLGTVLPLIVPRENYATKIVYRGLYTSVNAPGDEDFVQGVIWVYWGAQVVRGYVQAASGGGPGYHNGWLLSGNLSSLAPVTITGTSMNGYYASPGDAPRITAYAITAPTDFSISELPMVGRFRNVFYDITHYKKLLTT